MFDLTIHFGGPGRVAQSVTCLTADMCLTADPGMEFDPCPIPYFRRDCEIIFSLPLIQEGLLSFTSESMCTKYWARNYNASLKLSKT